MKYELYYNNGGHGGPYPDHNSAANRANDLLKGSSSMTSIEIRPLNSEHKGGYAPKHYDSTYLVKNQNGLISAQNF